MKKSQEAEIEAFLQALPPESKEIVRSLRALVARIAPGTEERLLWGGLSYHRPSVGGPVKGAVCQIVAKRGEVRLDFIHGVRLSDPSGLLKGDRISKRYVPMQSVADTERPEVAELIREAASLDPRQWA
jgi:hypothetical protein